MIGRIDATKFVPESANRPAQLHHNITRLIIIHHYYHNAELYEIYQKFSMPSVRVAALNTFVGSDYFGPLTVTVGRRIEKRWGHY